MWKASPAFKRVECHGSRDGYRAVDLIPNITFDRNPNFPPRQKFLTVNNRDRFEPSHIQWPAYDRHSQKYLNIGTLFIWFSNLSLSSYQYDLLFWKIYVQKWRIIIAQTRWLSGPNWYPNCCRLMAKWWFQSGTRRKMIEKWATLKEVSDPFYLCLP